MKKPILNLVAGIILGVILIIGIAAMINMKKEQEDILVQNTNSSATEEIGEYLSEFITEEFIETETEEVTETEIVSESETVEETTASESEKESEQEVKPQQAVSRPSNVPYYIRVNRLANCVTVYAKDAEGYYTVPVKSMICSVGLTDDTPLGVYSIYARYKWRPLYGNTYGQYAIRFYGSYLFHSVPYTSQSKDSLKEGQFNMLGEPASQGCVRLMVVDAKWLYDNCVNGTKVEVYESPDPGPLGKPTAYKISENSPYKGWDPTDPDPANPWKIGTVSITGVRDIVVNQGETADFQSGVSATDVDGLPLEVKTEGTVDWNTPGEYVITYSATSVLGMVQTANAKITVHAVEPPESEVPVEPETPIDSESPAEAETPEEPKESEISEESEETEISETEDSLIN